MAASAAEAELGALYLNVKQGRIIRLALEEMGHPQPPTPINCDNLTTTGIVNGTVKRQRSRSMEKNYFYVIDQVDNKQFIVEWYPGHENLGDYISKHHDERHHKEVRNIYLHDENSPRYLQRAERPSSLRGCVGTGRKGGIRPAPLTQLKGQRTKKLEDREEDRPRDVVRRMDQPTNWRYHRDRQYGTTKWMPHENGRPAR